MQPDSSCRSWKQQARVPRSRCGTDPDWDTNCYRVRGRMELAHSVHVPHRFKGTKFYKKMFVFETSACKTVC